MQGVSGSRDVILVLDGKESGRKKQVLQDPVSRLYRYLPEEECPDDRHCQAEPSDNGKADRRIDLGNTGQAIADPFHTVGEGIEHGHRHNPCR